MLLPHGSPSVLTMILFQWVFISSYIVTENEILFESLLHTISYSDGIPILVYKKIRTSVLFDFITLITILKII